MFKIIFLIFAIVSIFDESYGNQTPKTKIQTLTKQSVGGYNVKVNDTYIKDINVVIYSPINNIKNKTIMVYTHGGAFTKQVINNSKKEKILF